MENFDIISFSWNILLQNKKSTWIKWSICILGFMGEISYKTDISSDIFKHINYYIYFSIPCCENEGSWTTNPTWASLDISLFEHILSEVAHSIQPVVTSSSAFISQTACFICFKMWKMNSSPPLPPPPSPL